MRFMKLPLISQNSPPTAHRPLSTVCCPPSAFAGNSQFTICILRYTFFLWILLSPWILFAHSIDVSAAVEGKTIQGKASYHDGAPVGNADVRAFDPEGEEIGRTKTDSQGKFKIEAAFRCDHRLLIDANDGHGAEYTISAKALPADLPPRDHSTVSPDMPAAHIESDRQRPRDSALLAGIHDDVDALQEQLDRYEQRIRFRDILGGIGFIVGLSGAAYGYYYRGLLKKCRNSRE
jgi:nickel transport protein